LELDKDKLISVMNPYSKETATLPWFAVAVYEMIKGAESYRRLYFNARRIVLVPKVFPKEYYTLLD
jgi:hypothetical protein